MHVVAFLIIRLFAQRGFSLLLLFAFLACSGSPGVKGDLRPPEGVGINVLYRDLFFTEQGMESRFLRLISGDIPLGGPAFRVSLSPGGELGPEDFQVVRTRGVGTTEATVFYRAWQHPLEIRVHYSLNLTDPSFEKYIRVRWVGVSKTAPVLEKVVVEEIPVAGEIRGGGRGRPGYTDTLFALVDSAWGLAHCRDDKLILEESPGLSLAGGWWTSSRTILGPCGKASAQRAFIRWLAHRRGPTSLVLLAAVPRGGEKVPPTLSGITVMEFTEIAAQELAVHFPGKLVRRKGTSPGRRCLAIRLPAGLSAADSLFRKSVQVATSRLDGVGALAILGLRRDGKTRALGSFLEYLRASSFDIPVLVGWSGGEAALPLARQVRLAGQDGLVGDGNLGRARAMLSPWRRTGEPWSRKSGDLLVMALASGCGFVNLGVFPPPGKAREFLVAALQWTKARDDLLQGMHRPFPGEVPGLTGREIWLSRTGEETMVVVRGSGAVDWRQCLPGRGEWGTVVEVWPGGKRLLWEGKAAGFSTALAPVRVIHAWKAGVKVGSPFFIAEK